MSNSNLVLELVFEVCHGKADELYLPLIADKDWQMVVLDSHVDDKVFNTLMASLLNCCYDGKPIDSQFIVNMMTDDEMALGGGLRLTMNDKTISPSCCAEFLDFKAWASICHGKKPDLWLGHDPTPFIRYRQNDIFVVSDGDPFDESQDVFELKFTHQEYYQAFQKVQNDIFAICQFSKTWAVKYLAKDLQVPFIQAFYHYMGEKDVI